MSKLKRFIAVENSSGKVIAVQAADAEAAYRVVGRDVYGMPDPIDTGNVDVNLFDFPEREGCFAQLLEYRE